MQNDVCFPRRIKKSLDCQKIHLFSIHTLNTPKKLQTRHFLLIFHFGSVPHQQFINSLPNFFSVLKLIVFVCSAPKNQKRKLFLLKKHDKCIDSDTCAVSVHKFVRNDAVFPLFFSCFFVCVSRRHTLTKKRNKKLGLKIEKCCF